MILRNADHCQSVFVSSNFPFNFADISGQVELYTVLLTQTKETRYIQWHTGFLSCAQYQRPLINTSNELGNIQIQQHDALARASTRSLRDKEHVSGWGNM